ncbi:hypothetical protein D9M68_654210 [compost metagenome]
MLQPVSANRDVDAFNEHIGLSLPEDFHVGPVLVKHNDVSVAQAFQAGHKVLSDQTGSAREDDLFIQVFHASPRSMLFVSYCYCRPFAPTGTLVGQLDKELVGWQILIGEFQ